MAGVQRFQKDQLFGICLDRIGEFRQQVTTISCIHARPGWESGFGGFNGAIDVFFTRFGNLADFRIVVGVQNVNGSSTDGVNEFAANKQLGWNWFGQSGIFECW